MIVFRPARRLRARSLPRLAAVASLAIAASMASAGAAAQQALSLARALQLAQDRSRSLAAQDSAATAAREMAAAAGRLPDPQLKLGVNNLPVNGPDAGSLTRDFMTMRYLGVMQEFTRQAKRDARSARFEREADVAVAARDMALADLQRQTALAWLECHYRQRMRDLLLAQRDEARLQVDAADTAYRGGKGAQADVFAARSAVASIEDSLAQAQSQLANARAVLQRWTGLPVDEALPPPPDIARVPLHAAGLAHELAFHPEIAAMQKQEELARAEADVAKSEKLADWSVELMYSQRGPGYSNMVSIGVTVPLQWDQRHRQDRELAAKLAAVDQMRAQREEAVRTHEVETRTMLQEWQSDRERLERFDTALIPLSLERTRAATAAYRGNAGTLSSALDARRNEIDVRLARLRLELEAARLWAQLRYLTPDRALADAGRPEPIGTQQ
jgi:outer membrane protein TolC